MFNFQFGYSNEKESTLYEDENYYIDEDKYIEIVYKNDKLIYQKSKFQEIEVYTNKFFGNILVIDDDIQLTEHDEDNYHEMIAHVPLNYMKMQKKF